MAREKSNGGPPDEQQEDSVVPVVGIGASAGGLSALEALLPAIPAESGLAYVIVQHLDPDHESVLASLLDKMATVPVTVIKDRTEVVANHIYVIPPNARLTIVDDRLLLSPAVESGPRAPIDGFLISLAEARGEKAAGVILTGSGSDGTLGLRAIKEHGGLTLAQEGAEYDGMMRSAVRTGVVDFVLPLGQIPAKLTGYFRHLDGSARRPAENGEAADYLTHIAALLRTRTGHDFSGYKDRTVARRVQRRMQVLQIDQVPAFIERLRKDPKEIDVLLQDLLIGVTSFFRDPQAFEALERSVVPHLFANKGRDGSIRVWVPGCSTGEEAYSIAMLLSEHMPQGAAPKLQVFASDIDEHALQVARIGRYPATIAKDIPPKRLETYFVREDGTYRVRPELREACLFSMHNLLRDAPFSKLDVISCRNLLIYLTPELQNRLIPLFHYALNEDGHLFLGSSENISRHARLFSTVDKTHRIFRRRVQLERRLPEFPLSATDGARRRPTPGQRAVIDHQPLQSLAERQLLERYAPPYVVINGEGEVLHGSGGTGKYLELAAGAPRIDIFSMARLGLRSDLRAGVHKAASSGQPVVQKNVQIGTNGGRLTINLIIHPLRAEAAHDPLYMVVFQDVGAIRPLPEAEATDADESVESANLREIELELRTTRERLQSTTEELESANEELKSGNEELSSMNEELQSANEELETSKEELQSINEELQTVNSELNARVDELSRINSDIANLLEATQIATLFLDRDLAVTSFTPAAKDLFRLVPSDIGRPIAHVRSRFHADTVQDDAERVLRTLATIERHIENPETGRRYILRLMPYRTVNNMIAGVVITFTDSTDIAAAHTRIDDLNVALRDRIASLETLLDLVPVTIMILRDGQRPGEIRVNRYGAQLLGDALRGAEGEGPRLTSRDIRLFRGDREIPTEEHPLQLAARTGQGVTNFEGQLVRPDGEKRDVIVTATALLGDAGEVRGAIAAIVDISERKHAEARQQVLLYELQHRVKNIIATISALATRTLRNDPPAGEFADAFLGRLRGMAATHELLSRGNWRGAKLAELIEGALRAHTAIDGSTIGIKGPEVLMAPNAAATLGMAFYELATNAVKYGALSVPGGRVEVTWRSEGAPPGGRVEVSWRESGGKPSNPAAVPGFGTTFVKRSVEYELQGSADMQHGADGVRWAIEFPLQQNVQPS